ncbi:Hypothetical protein POVR1_LOCUS73 [uncultured virus]|nr:Hypothetical protein POVR1_LOCUS73 [uncultured virus]
MAALFEPNHIQWNDYVRMISSQGIKATDQQIDQIVSSSGIYRVSLEAIRESLACPTKAVNLRPMLIDDHEEFM